MVCLLTHIPIISCARVRWNRQSRQEMYTNERSAHTTSIVNTRSKCIGHGLWQIYSKLRFFSLLPILIALSSSSFPFHCVVISFFISPYFSYTHTHTQRRTAKPAEHETRIVFNSLFRKLLHCDSLLLLLFYKSLIADEAHWIPKE